MRMRVVVACGLLCLLAVAGMAQTLPVTLVPVAADADLPAALAKAGNYFLPAKNYAVKTSIVLEGWENGLIMGAGRLASGSEVNFAAGAGLRISNCKRLTLCNLSLNAANPAGGVIEVTGTVPCEIRLLNCTIASRNVLAPGQTSAPGLIVRGPGKVIAQECHFFHTDPGVLIDHPDADVRILGGNFQSTTTHIRQLRGGLQAYAIGFQLAHSGTDIELNTAAKEPFVIAAVRTEGPGTLVRVPETKEPITLIVKACGIATDKAPFVRYGAAGALAVLGNQSPNGLEATNGVIFSAGNRLGGSYLKAEPYQLGPNAACTAVGDVWSLRRDSDPYKEPCNGPLTAATLAEHGHAVPGNLKFLESGAVFSPIPPAPAPIWVPMPVIANLADLLPSVKLYGAVGDGLADDTAALQKALDENRLGQLFFPAGTYRITKPLFINQRNGGWLAGAGREQTVIVNTAGGGVITSDGCGYAAFSDLCFAVAPGSKAINFNLSWKQQGPNLPGFSGAALQANVFSRCRFVGGTYGLSIGVDDRMGSESLIQDCDFIRCDVGMATRNYNALSNNTVGCRFTDCGTALAQDYAGSYNAFDCRFEESRNADLIMRNSAADAFYIANCVSTAQKLVYGTGHTGAVINVFLDGFTYRGAGPNPIGSYAAGGTVIVLNSNIGPGKLGNGGSISHNTLLLIGSTYNGENPLAASGRAQKYLLPYPAKTP
jgi:hypothetical protein